MRDNQFLLSFIGQLFPGMGNNSTAGLERFITAQETTFSAALDEIQRGRKHSHWMWFIFPQIAGLGQSETSRFYAIKGLEEAQAYLQHPLLGSRLVTISRALLAHRNKSANAIFGSPDDLKLKSSMTLFASVKGADPVFKEVLDAFYEGKPDHATLDIMAGA